MLRKNKDLDMLFDGTNSQIIIVTFAIILSPQLDLLIHLQLHQ